MMSMEEKQRLLENYMKDEPKDFRNFMYEKSEAIVQIMIEQVELETEMAFLDQEYEEMLAFEAKSKTELENIAKDCESLDNDVSHMIATIEKAQQSEKFEEVDKQLKESLTTFDSRVDKELDRLFDLHEKKNGLSSVFDKISQQYDAEKRSLQQYEETYEFQIKEMNDNALKNIRMETINDELRSKIEQDIEKVSQNIRELEEIKARTVELQASNYFEQTMEQKAKADDLMRCIQELSMEHPKNTEMIANLEQEYSNVRKEFEDITEIANIMQANAEQVIQAQFLDLEGNDSIKKEVFESTFFKKKEKIKLLQSDREDLLNDLKKMQQYGEQLQKELDSALQGNAESESLLTRRNEDYDNFLNEFSTKQQQYKDVENQLKASASELANCNESLKEKIELKKNMIEKLNNAKTLHINRKKQVLERESKKSKKIIQQIEKAKDRTKKFPNKKLISNNVGLVLPTCKVTDKRTPSNDTEVTSDQSFDSGSIIVQRPAHMVRRQALSMPKVDLKNSNETHDLLEESFNINFSDMEED